ncbi:hypothetical protein MPER_13845 [Moniliophthora perniciosa FA553]|nr:hypothetical protein MPER_13845 [Moniliophthora perniciosa FA553]
MEVNEVLTQFGHNLPELIAEIRKDQTPNRKYNKDIDPDYREFLPPLIPLVRSGNRHLTISAGALKYPDTSFNVCQIEVKEDQEQFTIIASILSKTDRLLV